MIQDEKLNRSHGKKISIIIPCYNSEKYIEECFDSLKEQTFGLTELQVIFVNDASTDNTLEYLQRFASEYPQSVEVINLEKNHRQGGARNRGLACAAGEYVLFLDSDDWLDVTMCEKVYAKASEFDVDILQFPFVHVYGQGNMRKEECNRYGLLDAACEEVRKGMLLGTLFTFGSQNKLYRRALLEECKAAFPEGVVYEEPYFVYPLLFEARRFYSMEEGLYFYRRTGQSVTIQHMNEKETLYNHPFVQLELLKKLSAHKRYIQEYYSEIEFHFLHSYYMETLYFAGVGSKFLSIDYFCNMQKMVLDLFPAYEENPYLNLPRFVKLRKIMMSVKEKFTQEQLDLYCRQVVDIMDERTQQTGNLMEEKKREAEEKRKLREQFAGYQQEIDSFLGREAYGELLEYYQTEKMQLLSKIDNDVAILSIILNIYKDELQEHVPNNILSNIHSMKEARGRYLKVKFLMWRLEFIDEDIQLAEWIDKDVISAAFWRHLIDASSFGKANTAFKLAMLMKKQGKSEGALSMLEFVDRLSPDEEIVFCEMADIYIEAGRMKEAVSCLKRITCPTGIFAQYQEKWGI